MKQSINHIWNKGFTGEMALNEPQITDLYNQKSHNLIDRFEQLFALNHKLVVYAAVFFCIVLALFGAPVLGAIIGLMLVGLVFLGKDQLKALQNINKDQSCLHYLQHFDQWLDAAILQYTKIYRLFYPVLFSLCAFRFAISDLANESLLEMGLKTTDGQLDIMVYGGIAVISLLLGLLGGHIYRADLNMVYGAEINKLKELIADLQKINQVTKSESGK